MDSQAQEALRRLGERVPNRAAARWLERARVEPGPAGGYVLSVGSAFQKRWFEQRLATELRQALGGPVEIRAAPGAPAPVRRPSQVLPRLVGPAGEYAVRMVRAFVEGGPAAAPLVVVHGPPDCGKSALVEWAVSLAPPRTFRVDVERLRCGRSRGLVPRKPLVVIDGVERLAGKPAAQRTLCAIVDAVIDRGDRLLVTIAGHPAELEGLFPALRNRLKGGVPVRMEAPGRGDMRRQLRERARRHGVRLPREWEEELAALPPVSALRALDLRLGAPCGCGPLDAEGLLACMKDVAARLFGVERDLMEGARRRRSVVEARRSVMAAACRHGLDEEAVARAFGLRSTRTVRAACRWAAQEAARDPRFAALLHEVGRVVPPKE